MKIFNNGKITFKDLSNPIPAGLTYADTLAPHAETIRQTYTCNTQKGAYLQSAALSVKRESASTAIDQALIGVRVIRAERGTITIAIAAITTDVANFDMSSGFSGVIPLAKGDRVELFTSDASTGGNVGYNGSVVVLEGDLINAD